MPVWQKPENALRRANELLEVGKKQDALDTLHDVIKARRYRQWTKVHELIMNKHLELCVELRKPHLAKDGLFQYRNMCQQVNSKSLEDVINVFLHLAEKKAEQAKEESHGLVEDVEDLDQAESPEKLLLSAVSGEGNQERTDRVVLSPWLRFLWESYRQCLELLRNNVQVETLYHKVAKQAFQFCLKYQRKAEFRKLCDNLRTHLNQLQKTQYAHAHYALKLTNAETLAMHQETRLIQLDIAIQMELWQEAFKSADDVHQLMQLSKRTAKSSTLASYYEKLALIFWKADSALYHAASLMKLFQLTKEMKKTALIEELNHLATRVILSVLSVNTSGVCSDLSRHLEMEETQVENQRKLANLIMLPSPPTRQTLLKEIIRLNVLNLALPVVQKLYKLLEADFCPLSLAKQLEVQWQAVENLNKKEYTKYGEILKEVAAYKILKQVSQVYQTVTFEFLCKILPYYDRTGVERLIVTAGKKSQLQVRLHHRNESLDFGGHETACFGSEDDDSSGGTLTMGGGAQLNVPVIQTMPNEQIKQHLQQMYVVLYESMGAVDNEAPKSLLEQIRNQITVYGYHIKDQHAAILERRKKIELYKEMAEKIRFDQEEKQKEQERRLNEQKQRENEIRLQQENLQRLEVQKRREQEELQKRMMQDRLEKMKDPKLRKIIEDLPEDELQNLDHDLILQKQISHLEQEKREQMTRFKQQEKKWDYFVRAMHVEEIPLRDEEYKKWAVNDKDMWENYEEQRVQNAILDHHNMVEAYNRLRRMEDDAQNIIQTVLDSRAGQFKERLAAWEKLLKETREKRLQERKEERRAKRREEWLQQKKEQERKKKEEEERLKREQEQAGRRQMGAERRGERAPAETTETPDNWRTAENRPELPAHRQTGGGRTAQPQGDWRNKPQEQRGGPPPQLAADGATEQQQPEDWRGQTRREPLLPPPSATSQESGPRTTQQQRGDESHDWRGERPGPMAPPSGREQRGGDGFYRPPIRENREPATMDDHGPPPRESRADGERDWRGSERQQAYHPPQRGPPPSEWRRDDRSLQSQQQTYRPPRDDRDFGSHREPPQRSHRFAPQEEREPPPSQQMYRQPPTQRDEDAVASRPAPTRNAWHDRAAASGANQPLSRQKDATTDREDNWRSRESAPLERSWRKN